VQFVPEIEQVAQGGVQLMHAGLLDESNPPYFVLGQIDVHPLLRK